MNLDSEIRNGFSISHETKNMGYSIEISVETFTSVW